MLVKLFSLSLLLIHLVTVYPLFVVVFAVVPVVDVPINKDDGTLCVHEYEIDVAKPIRLFTISNIE